MLATFYESKNAGGLANTLRKWSVNGADLLAFDTCQDVETELHVPPFAAKKIITMRDAALALVNLVSIQSESDRIETQVYIATLPHA